MLAAGLFILLFGCTSSPNTTEERDPEVKAVTMHEKTSINDKLMLTPESVELRMDMRKLWEDHVTWTRTVICCLVDDLPGADQAIDRLLQNQDDIGNAVKPYYGNEAGNQLSALLRDHITISADVVKAARAGDNTSLDAANKKWYENADAISAFLVTANPNWELGEMQTMMHDHLKLTTKEAVARIKKDYAGDVKAYDQVHEEILEMSDMLAAGIIKQFPEKFGIEYEKQ